MFCIESNARKSKRTENVESREWKQVKMRTKVAPTDFSLRPRILERLLHFSLGVFDRAFSHVGEPFQRLLSSTRKKV